MKKVGVLLLAVVMFAVPVAVEIVTNPRTADIIKEQQDKLAVQRINARDQIKARKITRAKCNARRG